MKPRLALVFVATCVAMGYGVYNVKYKVRELKVEARALKEQIRSDREGIQVLDAEWAYLTRPNRLEGLASRYLDLGVIKPKQVARMSEIDAVLPPLIEARTSDPQPAEGTRLAAVQKGK